MCIPACDRLYNNSSECRCKILNKYEVRQVYLCNLLVIIIICLCFFCFFLNVDVIIIIIIIIIII